MKVVRLAAMLAALSLVTITVGLLSGQTSTPEIMRQKMDRAEKLLRSLVLAEFEGIEEHARELDRLAELQSWYVLPTPEYADHSKKFREAAQAAADAGKAKRVDESFEAYSAAIRECVDCHEYMRRVRRQR